VGWAYSERTKCGAMGFSSKKLGTAFRMYADRAECSAERGDSLCMHISTPVYRPEGYLLRG
jgi:hypothetical protein